MHDHETRSPRRRVLLVVAFAIVMAAGFFAVVLYSFMQPQLLLAKQKRTMVDLERCRAALEAFHERHGGYPAGDWESSVQALAEETLLESTLLRDHWNHPLVYVTSGEVTDSLAGGYTLSSCGEDGVCEEEIPASGEFDHLDYASDLVIENGSWRRAPLGRANQSGE